MSTTTSTLIPTGTWSVDPAHSRVGFAVRHLGIATIRGEFTKFEGVLELGDDLAAARASGSVEVSSVFTNAEERDQHLRSADFFDAAQYPTITFASTAITPLGDGAFEITGELTLHGVTNEVVLRGAVQGTEIDPWTQAERVGLEVSGEISREAFGMGFNMTLGSGMLLVSDKVQIVIDISAVKQS